jgi:hypothetical protein
LKFSPFCCLKFNLFPIAERQQGDGSFLISVLVHDLSEADSLHCKPIACGICVYMRSMSKAVLPSLRTRNTGFRGSRPLAPCTRSIAFEFFQRDKKGNPPKCSSFLD